MSTDVTFAREETTERRTLSTAEAAVHPALANSFARKADQRSAPQLLRVPRASLPPVPEVKTQLTPAPVFDDEVELLEDSGLLTLVAENADPIEELSARFLIDEEAREVQAIPLRAPPRSDELSGMDELDSAHLAFVETKGEIRSQSPVTKLPKSRLVSLHEKALADGITQYSDGVPCHNLEGGGQISRTLRVRATGRDRHTSPWRHVPVLLVFAAGIGAGTFFALKNSNSSPSPVAAVAAASAPLPSATPAVNALVAEPVKAERVNAEPVNAEPVNAELVITAPVVKPLVDESALSGVQVTPLPQGSEASDEASADEAASALSPPPAARATRARAKSTPSRPIGSQPVTGTADPGVLMLGAKPPCSIRIDGKDTGLVTPQRVLQLSPGKHKIVLVNEEHDFKDSFVVSIQSGEKTRVIRDNTNKIK